MITNKILTGYRGYPVRLTEERVRHILEHPEMAVLHDKIEETLQFNFALRGKRIKTTSPGFIVYRFLENLLGNIQFHHH
jgi:hypothetical protein